MAVPSATIEIVEINETSKTITYKVSYSTSPNFKRNENNYYQYLATKNNDGEPYVEYEYTGKNPTGETIPFQTEYDNYQTSKTITITYAYYKIYPTESWSGSWVNYGSGSYSSKEEATTNMLSYTGGNQGLYRVIEDGNGRWFVQKKKGCTYSEEKSSIASYGTATATATFEKKPESTELPDFDLSFKSYTNSITAIISGITAGDLVSVTIGGKTITQNSSGASISITIKDLTPFTEYDYSVSVSGYKGPKTGTERTTEKSTPSGDIEVEASSKSVKFNVSDLDVGQKVIAYTRIEPTDGVTLWKGSYSRGSDDPSSKSPFATWTGASYNQLYAAGIYLYQYDNDPNPTQLAYETFKFEQADANPKCQVVENSITETSGQVKVINLKEGDKVRVTLYQASAEIKRIETEAQDTILEFEFKNLTPNTYYTVSVQVNGKPIQGTNFTTKTTSYNISNITSSSITIHATGLPINTDVRVSVAEASEKAYTTGNTGSQTSIILTVEGLSSSTDYEVNVRYGDSTWIGVKRFTTLFEWQSTIEKGKQMEYFQGKPAPITANEWNNLIHLVNRKFNKSIIDIWQGHTMSADKINEVASVVGKSVSQGEAITASFFISLRDAVNSRLN